MNSVLDLLSRSQAKGHRSTVMVALQWTLGLLLPAWLVAIRFDPASAWIILMMVCVTLAVLLGTFLYCLSTNPDLLRSENFSLEKLRIERGIQGDTLSGFDIDDQEVIDSPVASESKRLE